MNGDNCLKIRSRDIFINTIEQSVKSQFAKIFATSDWKLFKKIADANLSEAVSLLTTDMYVNDSLKLLARNSRKRLLIGVGVELLLKAIYLKQGYAINKPLQRNSPKFPFLLNSVANAELDEDDTFNLNDLIDNLHKVIDLVDKSLTVKGLKIAKVYRNKEGHVVTKNHTFDPANYTDIALSLTKLYKDAFGEKLSVQFSFAQNEQPIWQIATKRL
jgi:hypothetical protein